MAASRRGWQASCSRQTRSGVKRQRPSDRGPCWPSHSLAQRAVGKCVRASPDDNTIDFTPAQLASAHSLQPLTTPHHHSHDDDYFHKRCWPARSSDPPTCIGCRAAVRTQAGIVVTDESDVTQSHDVSDTRTGCMSWALCHSLIYSALELFSHT